MLTAKGVVVWEVHTPYSHTRILYPVAMSTPLPVFTGVS